MRVRWVAELGRSGRAVLAATLLFGAAGCQTPTPPATPQPPPSAVNGVGFMVVNGPIVPRLRELFVQDVNNLRATGAREIDIGLNSTGGDIDVAQQIVDFMDRLHRTDGVTFKITNIGVVASAATFIFLNAQERFTDPRGAFLFHAAGLVANGPVNSDQLRESADKIDAYDRKMRAVMLARTHLTESEAQTYLKRTVVLTSDDARRDGIVDAIAPFRGPPNARLYLLTTKPPAGAAAAPSAGSSGNAQGR